MLLIIRLQVSELSLLACSIKSNRVVYFSMVLQGKASFTPDVF